MKDLAGSFTSVNTKEALSWNITRKKCARKTFNHFNMSASKRSQENLFEGKMKHNIVLLFFIHFDIFTNGGHWSAVIENLLSVPFSAECRVLTDCLCPGQTDSFIIFQPSNA